MDVRLLLSGTSRILRGGRALVRYRIGDLFEVISLKDEEPGSPLPQFRFYLRADDVIDLELAWELSKVSSEFGGLAEIPGCEPLQISFLKPGSFEAYMKQKQREGADLAHIKPTHSNRQIRSCSACLKFESSPP